LAFRNCGGRKNRSNSGGKGEVYGQKERGGSFLGVKPGGGAKIGGGRGLGYFVLLGKEWEGKEERVFGELIDKNRNKKEDG